MSMNLDFQTIEIELNTKSKLIEIGGKLQCL